MSNTYFKGLIENLGIQLTSMSAEGGKATGILSRAMMTDQFWQEDQLYIVI